MTSKRIPNIQFYVPTIEEYVKWLLSWGPQHPFSTKDTADERAWHYYQRPDSLYLPDGSERRAKNSS